MFKNISSGIILDFQGFTNDANKFIIKELASYDGNNFFHTVFKPPYPLETLSRKSQYTIYWLTNNHHGLRWDIGNTPYSSLPNILNQLTCSKATVYIKGLEKSKHIQKLIDSQVEELPERPALIKSTPKCKYHNIEFCICSLTNVFTMYDLFFKNNK